MDKATASAPLSVARGILNAAARYPHAIAIESSDSQFTYEQLADRIRRLACAALTTYSLKPGSVVALLAPNRIEYLEVVTGLAEAGIAVATLNPRLNPEELARILDDCAPALAIADPSLTELIDVVAARGVPVLSLGPNYETLLSAALVSALPPVDEYTAFCISYTSGTTGAPKGVLLPHRSRALVSLASAIEYQCFGPGDRFLSIVPLFHGGGFAFSLASVSYGGTCILHDVSDGESIVSRIEKGDIHGVFMVPTHFKRIHDLPDERFEGLAQRHALSSIISNAAALAPRFKQLTVDRFGRGLLHETYGSTEAGIVTNMRPDRILDLPESVGTPFTGMEVEIRQADGNLCGDDEVGELFARGPYTFIGYLNRPEATAEALHDGWVTVQDLAVRDSSGYISIVGRAKDMVVSGGVNIYPAEIEKVIAQVAGVAEVAVVGIADAEWGERVHAFVVPIAQGSVDLEQIQEKCRESLSGYKVPRGITFIDDMPRNPSGKILKRELREFPAASLSAPD